MKSSVFWLPSFFFPSRVLGIFLQRPCDQCARLPSHTTTTHSAGSILFFSGIFFPTSLCLVFLLSTQLARSLHFHPSIDESIYELDPQCRVVLMCVCYMYVCNANNVNICISLLVGILFCRKESSVKRSRLTLTTGRKVVKSLTLMTYSSFCVWNEKFFFGSFFFLHTRTTSAFNFVFLFGLRLLRKIYAHAQSKVRVFKIYRCF